MTDLHLKVCVACEGTESPLGEAEIAKLLQDIEGWEVERHSKIIKTYTFTDFQTSIDFINKVAQIAEQEGHHPDINLHHYKKVTISLSTHAIGGLSENDFILASKIDHI